MQPFLILQQVPVQQHLVLHFHWSRALRVQQVPFLLMCAQQARTALREVHCLLHVALVPSIHIPTLIRAQRVSLVLLEATVLTLG